MVTVDDPSVWKVSGEVLVLDCLHQAQLGDRPVLDGSHQPDKHVLALHSLEMSHHVHVLVLDLLSLPARLLSESEVEGTSWALDVGLQRRGWR